ncbi:type I-F CRISPR-associated protein Csy1 [Aquaspirillum serpens]|uniref:type I-F CRISPR-associated protein Csy1 n=1 Tax=Aquaspirillum serpens TaxID=190 RepID=UPI0003B59866|nr:type I-F CRISPR-associated protein Csy1 [Aquaspirillum serpens]
MSEILSEETSPITASDIRTVISSFLTERLQGKLDKLKAEETEARDSLIDAFTPAVWIADAARRVEQIQQVTHALKFNHPDAKGSSLSSTGNKAALHYEFGSHSFNHQLEPDVVGNAAALDVYKFLRLKVAGQTVLDLCLTQHPALMDLFCEYSGGETQEAENWCTAFATLPEPKGELASHKLSKQIYWPLSDGTYHLLLPLFPTSLAHHVWNTMRQDRFSDEAKAAREARKIKKHHDHGYRDYPNIATQHFGGTKPQNISQLNSERHGENWLLASCPPTWQNQNSVQPPLQQRSIFSLFGRRKNVRFTLNALKNLLGKAGDYNNVAIREARAALIDDICDELLQYTAELQALPAGWSKNSILDEAEQYWLDPERGNEDEDFANRRSQGQWLDEVTRNFANWLNSALDKNNKQLHFGDAEAQAWQTVLEDRLQIIRWSLNHG